ncbi:MAG: PD40 domain-containing protein [Candidatus Sabulitectum sp.]|nr:PD40 domain-containing protein [Candidatus Sabulitectum sp.]
MRFFYMVTLILLSAFFSGCDNSPEDPDGQQSENRQDDAFKVSISENGSLQNPAWSPAGGSVLFTRFVNGYNTEPADLFVIDLGDNSVRTLVSDGSGNISLPGSVWNEVSGKIVFASTRDPHDEIYMIDENGISGDETRITSRSDKVAYEPSFSPDGQYVVFESHLVDVENDGVITIYKVDGSEPYTALTVSGDDCRQPNWSPAGDLVLYQRYTGGQWDIWVMSSDGTNQTMVTTGTGDKTDASFSPDGQWIVYSSNEGGLDSANLFVVPASGGSSVRVSNFSGYDGAPSWSPDGNRIAFESCPGDPDESEGTSVWVINVPELP